MATTNSTIRKNFLDTYKSVFSESDLIKWEKSSPLFKNLLSKYQGSFELGGTGAGYNPATKTILMGTEYQAIGQTDKFVLTLSHELTHAVGQSQSKTITKQEEDKRTPTTYDTAWKYIQARHEAEGEAEFNEYIVARELNKVEELKAIVGSDRYTALVNSMDKLSVNQLLSNVNKQNFITKFAKLNETATFSGQPVEFDFMKEKYPSFYYTYAEENQVYFLYHFTNLNKDYKEVMGDDLFVQGSILPYGTSSEILEKMAHIKSLTNIVNGKDYVFYGINNKYNFLNLSDNDAKHNQLGKDVIKNLMLTGTELARQTGNHELLYGGNGADEIIGNELKEILLGGAGHDKLYGNDGDDILGGNAGNDTLDGGAGRNVLNGGKGKDTYYISGSDTIVDSDRLGAVHFKMGTNNQTIQAKSFVAVGKDVWASVDNQNKFDGKMIATRQGTFLSIIAGSHAVIVNDFFGANAKKNANTLSWNGLGISLKDSAFEYPQITKPTSTQKNHTLFHFTHEYINKLSATATEAQHETARLAAAVKNSGSETDDMLMSTQNGGSVVFLNGGNDLAYGGYGYDWLYGGLGNDMLIGSSLAALNSRPDKYGLNGNEALVPTHLLDRDYLVGGAGSDLIFGVDGNDVIFTDEDGFEKGKIAGHLQPENAKESLKRGDLAAGGKGDDMIYGSQMRDLLSGGAGSDTIFGGAGRDVLVGDGEFFPEIKRFYQVTANVINDKNQLSEDSSIFRVQHLDFTPSSAEFANPKHANNQNAWDFQINTTTHQFKYQNKVGIRLGEHSVKIGGASDYLFGGIGDDLLIGQFGNDYLDGGDGNDYLWGDDYLDKAISGNDTLKGGAGSNVLYGGKGDDSYIFTSADLKNKADKNIIRDEDGLGKIIIDGVALHSIAWKADPKNKNTHWTDARTGLDLRLADGNLTVSSNKFAAKITIENFKNGALGLKLLATPSARMIHDDESFVYATQTNPQEIHLHENQII